MRERESRSKQLCLCPDGKKFLFHLKPSYYGVMYFGFMFGWNVSSCTTMHTVSGYCALMYILFHIEV
jgi:hypothetical protein